MRKEVEITRKHFIAFGCIHFGTVFFVQTLDIMDLLPYGIAYNGFGRELQGHA